MNEEPLTVYMEEDHLAHEETYRMYVSPIIFETQQTTPERTTKEDTDAGKEDEIMRDADAASEVTHNTVATLQKWPVKDQNLYCLGKYCYGFALLRVGEILTFVMETPKHILLQRRKARQMGGDHDAGLVLKISNKLLDEEQERQRTPPNPRIARLIRGSQAGNTKEIESVQRRSAEPAFRFKNGEELIEVSFTVSHEEAEFDGLFVYQFFLQDTSCGAEIYRAQSVPSTVLIKECKRKQLYLLVCHVFKRKQQITRGELKRLFKILSDRIDFVKRCIRSHPYEDATIDGAKLPYVLHWFMKCCDTFTACRILFDYSVMFGFLKRDRTEEILGVHEEGSLLFRIGSSEVGGLVMSTRINGKFVHVTIDPPTDREVLRQLTVPSLLKVVCYDGTPLPKGNFVGLFRAEGMR